ncbi:hypothetical protein NRK68_36560 (plasmid) [Streptomyces yangpuensis]|uniref:Uncharacterized protein n=1 Tax=Streptomyces yangpuensis TaxID=1648182 RepID=A0ABY5Q958_9ACTN|nr:hypothetical protein [Streptomyces yangpuensis]UUY52770.1 hypothetical protein NRK68_36560 [Streptomyces yangpuensis]
MARTKPTAAHLALIRALKEHGCKPSPTQVERWQQEGWVPKSSTWFEPGSLTIQPHILRRALMVALTVRQGRGIGWTGWFLWASDATPENAQRLRTALVAHLKRPLARAGVDKIPTGNSNRAFQARRAAATKMLRNRRLPRRDLDETLRAHAAEVGLELPRLPDALPNVFHRALMDPGARLLLGGAADLGSEELLEALEQAMPNHTEKIERMREEHRQAELDGTDLLAQSPWGHGIPGMVRTVETADDRDLCHAVYTCTQATGALHDLMRRSSADPEIIALLMRDVMWQRWARVGGVTPEGTPGLAAVALNTVQYLAEPDWAADLVRYMALMHALDVAYPARRGTLGGGLEA